MINILVTAVGGGVGQAVLRSLKLSTHNLNTIGVDIDPWSVGLYAVNQAYIIPHYSHPDYINSLLDICKKNNINLLIPGSDLELQTIANNKENFTDIGTEVVVGTPESVKVCRNKLYSSKFFQEKKLPFVKTVLLKNNINVIDDKDFPLIIKPLSGSASQGVDVIFNYEELERYSDDLDKYIVQEYLIPETWGIDKEHLRKEDVISNNDLKQIDEISVQFLISKSGEIISCFMSQNILKQGVPVKIKPIFIQEVYDVSRKMVEELATIGLTGPVNLQGKLTKKGPVFFEINHRFTGITAVRAELGFNECDAIIMNFSLGESVETVRNNLSINYEKVCSRYITEMIIDNQEFETLNEKGILNHPKGKSYNL